MAQPYSLPASRLRWLERFMLPRSRDDDLRRREFIFTVLLLGAITLAAVAVITMLYDQATMKQHYQGWPPATMLVPLLALIALYWAVRRQFREWQVYLFLGWFIALATAGLLAVYYALPEGLLGYALALTMAGILLSVRAAWLLLCLIVVCLCLVAYVQTHHIVMLHLGDTFAPMNSGKVVIFSFVLFVMVVLTWLSNRDIEHSLWRARVSEAALRRERNNLEATLRRRTRQLEQAELQGLLELQRFADFGRLSSTLMHELANPLTAVALELEQLRPAGPEAQAIAQARQGVAQMHAYLEAARRQLRQQTKPRVFNTAREIQRVAALLAGRLRRQEVDLESDLAPGLRLYGDTVRFDQIVMNLIVNALEAYADSPATHNIIRIRTQRVVKDKPQLELQVIDFGSGIAARDLPHIFTAFYSQKSGERGTGIGLSIAKHAVEEGFGGTISVTSKPGSGTKFIVTIPLHEPKARS